MNETFPLRAVHAAYRFCLTPARRRFERAARMCERAQTARLLSLVKTNCDTAYGRVHRFDRVSSVTEWQSRVPIVGYEDLEPWIRRAANGERGVLTAAPVRAFERTSGSTAANKLVPYTDALLAEFGAATGPWLHDLYTGIPTLRGTRSYWSISPVARTSDRTPGGIPIGFDDDTEYFGRVSQLALRWTLAVPPAVARLPDMEAWSTATASHLVATADLGLVSVWHPSFFTLLLRTIDTRIDELLDRVPPARSAAVRERLQRMPLGEALWPGLAIISCWADHAAADALPALRRYVPHARVQPKGLLATEGVVSFPLLHGDSSFTVAAVAGHFLEFVDLDHPIVRPHLAHELRVGAAYAPVLSTGGGLYRYRLGDAVHCRGFHGQAPILQFDGRVDQVSDLCGEKLDVRMVATALRRAQEEAAVSPVFTLLAPARGDGPRYRLYVEGLDAAQRESLGWSLERALAECHGYAYARTLGQLAPIEVCEVRDGAARYQRARVEAGQRAGDVKPTYLDDRVDWTAVFATGERSLDPDEASR